MPPESEAAGIWPWSAVAASPEYSSASNADKRVFEQRYFADVIVPMIQAGEREQARRLFEAQVRGVGPAGGLPKGGAQELAEAADWWAEKLTQSTPVTRFAKGIRDVLVAKGIGEPSLEEQWSEARRRNAGDSQAFRRGLEPLVVGEITDAEVRARDEALAKAHRDEVNGMRWRQMPSLPPAAPVPREALVVPPAASQAFPGQPEPEGGVEAELGSTFPQEERREAAERITDRVRAAHGARATGGLFYQQRLRNWLDRVYQAIELQDAAAGGQPYRERF